MNETTKPEASNAVAGRFKPFVSWPRGKYNGRRIEGFKFQFDMHLLWWNWKPRFRWNYGEPYFIWLCFTFRLRAYYEERQYK
jgi:hypothetical protein